MSTTPRINLLPWRDEIREKRKKEFFLMCALAAVAAAGIVGMGSIAISEQISAQEASNQIIKTEITRINNELGQIKELKNRLDDMNKQKGIVESLQKDRADTVALMQGLLPIIPEQVFLTEVIQEGKKITLNGTARDAAASIKFLENINNTPFAVGAQLIQTKADKGKIETAKVDPNKPITKGAADQGKNEDGDEFVVHNFSVIFNIDLNKLKQGEPPKPETRK